LYSSLVGGGNATNWMPHRNLIEEEERNFVTQVRDSTPRYEDHFCNKNIGDFVIFIATLIYHAKRNKNNTIIMTLGAVLCIRSRLS
jgi:hypothetical protein